MTVAKLDPEVVLEALTGSCEPVPDRLIKALVEIICEDFNKLAAEGSMVALDRSYDLQIDCNGDLLMVPIAAKDCTIKGNVVVTTNGTVITPDSDELVKKLDVETYKIKPGLYAPTPFAVAAPEAKKLFASWKCLGQQCPDRPSQECPYAPLCYTCGEEMNRVL